MDIEKVDTDLKQETKPSMVFRRLVVNLSDLSSPSSKQQPKIDLIEYISSVIPQQPWSSAAVRDFGIASTEIALKRIPLCRNQKNHNALKDKIQQKLQIPKMQNSLNKDDPTIIVWRGMSINELEEIVRLGSIGKKANEKISPPTEDQAKAQVGEMLEQSLPEFTVNPKIAEAFARGPDAIVGCFAIKARYLTPGSFVESGVVCNKGAPIELIGWTALNSRLGPRVDLYF